MGAETRMGQRWASPAPDQHCLAMHTASPLCKPKSHAQDLEDKPGATDNFLFIFPMKPHGITLLSLLPLSCVMAKTSLLGCKVQALIEQLWWKTDLVNCMGFWVGVREWYRGD